MKIRFKDHILPHILAILVFLLVTILFFNPVFFDNRTLGQHDIAQWEASSKALRDYRAATGNEGLWTPSMFSGMPAYLVNLDWSDGVIVGMKKALSFGLPHPVVNIYWAFLSYYIMLLAFRMRPMLAIAGALAFGLSSYLIIGLLAGHNARIGSIAFMPLVMAGIHLTFSGKKILGFGVTTGGLAFHLRENHLQMTYYLVLIVLGYGLMQLIIAAREKRLGELFKTVGLLVPAALIAAATFFGQFWAITEYSRYSIRGPSDLKNPNAQVGGLSKEYAFAYSNGIGEPMTLMIPNFYGGSSGDFFVQDEESNTYRALVQSGDNNLANQLASYTRAYWGPQSLASPYYGGAIVVFLFVLGILLAERKYVYWLVPLAALSIMLSWGSSFPSFNYLMFDYFPGYDKFRSVTFALIIILFAMPLLGMLGLEQLLEKGLTPEFKRRLLIAFGATGGLCLVLWLGAGMMGFVAEGESQFPAWFLNALKADRQELFRGDAIRSFAFIAIVFALLYFEVQKRISSFGFFALLIFLIAIDLTVVDRRYISTDNYQRKRASRHVASAADEEILKDKSYYRVYNLQESFSIDGSSSYFHHSVGGYHGAKLRRYQELYDSCLFRETNEMIRDFRQGVPRFENYGIINMLNVRYLLYGPDKDNFVTNPEANGPAWFVKDLVKVTSANEELERVCELDTKNAAVMDESKFNVASFGYDSAATIELQEMSPPVMRYQSRSAEAGLAVFSEIYYPKGWRATIDGQEASIKRVNYVLRALEVPAGEHAIEFRFEPKAYTIGNKVTFASSWLMALVLLGCVGWTIRQEFTK
ncbi:MAG: YfhO family protein [Cyclobacteriaceae bacterium]